MTYGVLGGVRVHGRPIDAFLERRILAVLLACRNRPVAVDELIDIVWEGLPPAQARNALASKLSRLRSFIGRTLDPITRDALGYTLHVDPSACDADLFADEADRLLDNVRAEPEKLAALHRSWTGAPYGEFSSDEFASAEVVRLERLREQVGIRLAERLLDIGAPGRALVVADEVATEVSDNDRVVVVQATARWKLGEPREALELLNRHRIQRRTAGLDVSAEVDALEQAILRDTTPTPDDDSETGAPTPALIGRDQLLDTALARLIKARQLTLVGVAGFGTTDVAHEVGRRAGHVAANVDIAQVRDKDLAHLLDQIDVELDRAIGRRLPVVVIDRAHADPRQACAIIDRVLSRPASLVVIASHRRLGHQGEQHLGVSALDADGPDAPAVHLLERAIREAGAEILPEDRPAIEQLAQHSGGIPRLLMILAERVAFLDAASVLARVESDGVCVFDNDTFVAALVDDLDQLPEPALRLLAFASCFADGFSLDDLDRACTLASFTADRAETEDHLFDVADLHLVVRQSGEFARQRHRLLPPVRDVVRAIVATRYPDALSAVCESVVELVEAASADYPSAADGRWASILREERCNLEHVWSTCFGSDDDLAIRLVAGLLVESIIREWPPIRGWAESLIGSRSLVGHRGAAHVWAIVTHGRLVAGDPSGALEAGRAANAAITRGADPNWSVASDLFLLAVIGDGGRMGAAAREQLDELRRFSAATGNPMGALLAAWDQAFAAVSSGRELDAIGPAIEALRLSRRGDSPTLRAMGSHAIGIVWSTRRPDRAAAHFTQARRNASVGGCDALLRQVEQADATLQLDAAGPTPSLAERGRSLAAHATYLASEQIRQELTGLLYPLLHAGRASEAAVLCGGLTNSPWEMSATVVAVRPLLVAELGSGPFRVHARRGRRLTVDEAVALAVEACEHGDQSEPDHADRISADQPE